MKLLHAADLHLDSPFRALPREEADLRREELRQVLDELARLSLAEQCQMVLLAGDVFDRWPAEPRSIQALQRFARTVGVPVCIAPGNHDPYTREGAYFSVQWPENLFFFTGEQPESIAFPELDCRVWGAAFRQMDCPGLEPFRATGPETHQIMVLHGDPVMSQSPSRAVSREAVAATGLEYLALGHIHKPGSFRAGQTLCAWPGCPAGRGFDETGAKGAFLVTLRQEVSLEFRPLSARRYEELTVEVGPDALDSIVNALPEHTQQDYYRILLRGKGPVALADLEKALAPRFFRLTLTDETTLPRDPWLTAGEDSLEGLYFRLLQAQLSQADPDTARQIQLAARLSRDYLDGEEVRLP